MISIYVLWRPKYLSSWYVWTLYLTGDQLYNSMDLYVNKAYFQKSYCDDLEKDPCSQISQYRGWSGTLLLDER